VRAQSYAHWDYVIVNNCSTDGSVEIARRFAEADSRIRVVDNEALLPAVANHNHALRQISPASKYCKVVFSDDWLFPRCLEEMVALAEAHPSVGIVGAFGIQGLETGVKWAGLPYPSHCADGRDVGRRLLLEDSNGFGTAHAQLYRSDLVRKRDPFFNEANVHCDRETFIDLMRNWDFGFIHQILTFTRERPGSRTSFSQKFNTYLGGRLCDMIKFGPTFLTSQDYRRCRAKLFDEYYNFLAVSLLIGRRDKAFWNYHKEKLVEAGVNFSQSRFAVALLARCLKAAARPWETYNKMKLIRSRKYYRAANEDALTELRS
jgi:glycosyltransferase involved in cell wall biosynthesis